MSFPSCFVYLIARPGGDVMKKLVMNLYSSVGAKAALQIYVRLYALEGAS